MAGKFNLDCELSAEFREIGLIISLETNPDCDPLRSDSRYHELVRRIGFPEE